MTYTVSSIEISMKILRSFRSNFRAFLEILRVTEARKYDEFRTDFQEFLYKSGSDAPVAIVINIEYEFLLLINMPRMY